MAAAYTSVWAECKPGSPFLLPAYLRAVSGSTRLVPQIFLVRIDERPVLSAWLFSRSVGPFVEIVQAPHTPFSAIVSVGSADDTQVCLASILNNLASDFASCVITLPPEVRLSSAPDNWVVDERNTFYFDLPNYSTDSRSTNVRRVVNKFGGAYAYTSDPTNLQAVLDLVESSLARKGIKFVHRHAAKSIAESLIRDGHASVLTAARDGDIEAGIILLQARETEAAYWLAGSARGPAMTVLISNTLEKLNSHGFGAFDFVGANTPTVADFKRRFGPAQVSYQMLSCSNSKLLATLKKARRSFRK